MLEGEITPKNGSPCASNPQKSKIRLEKFSALANAQQLLSKNQGRAEVLFKGMDSFAVRTIHPRPKGRR